MSQEVICIPNIRKGGVSEVRSTTLQNDAHSKVIQFEFAPGRGLSAHTAPFAITMFLLWGEATIRIGEEVHEAGEGFWAYLPAGLEHSITAKSEVALLVTMVKEAVVSKV
jgi:quercetin dioxygenase-like cupin family protein